MEATANRKEWRVKGLALVVVNVALKRRLRSFTHGFVLLAVANPYSEKFIARKFLLFCAAADGVVDLKWLLCSASEKLNNFYSHP